MLIANEVKQMTGYPVLVRVDKMTMFETDFKDTKETKQISLQFMAAHWFVEGDHEYPEKNVFIIFVSEKAFNELSRPRTFSPHYIAGKGWRSADYLSAETRNELLSSAMRKVKK